MTHNAMGSLLKKLRGDRTQEEVGVALGVGASAVANWESGRQMPRRAMLPLMAQELGVPVQDLEKAMRASPCDAA